MSGPKLLGMGQGWVSSRMVIGSDPELYNEPAATVSRAKWSRASTRRRTVKTVGEAGLAEVTAGSIRSSSITVVRRSVKRVFGAAGLDWLVIPRSVRLGSWGLGPE